MQQYINELMELKEKTRDFASDFLKHIVLVSGALLAVIVSLSQYFQGNRILFLLVVIFLLLAILSGTTALYIILWQYRRLSKDFLEKIINYMKNPEGATPKAFSKRDSALQVAETVSLISFLLSTICLALYAFV